MRSRNIKYNSSGKVGGASCLLLLLLTFLATNPVTSVSAFADEGDVEEVGEPVTQADEGRVEIAFTPTEVSGELTPLTNDGVKKQLEATATVSIQNAEEYAIYLGVKTTGLVGVNSGMTIESIKTATNYDDLEANSWGIYYGEGTSVPANAQYKPVEIGQGVTLGSGSKVNMALTKTYALGFAANINNEVPADTYRNEITLSVVSSPLEVVNAFGIETMQEMTSEICSDVEVGTTDRLRDSRDDKIYWVKKMPDNQCWMVQNLDLDLGMEWPDASKSDYDIATTAYTPIATQTQQITGDADQVNTRSWDLGEWVINKPSVSSSCGSGKNNLSSCTTQVANVEGLVSSVDPDFYKTKETTVFDDEYDAHYLIGNYYSWNTATAGTGGMITSGEASGSICPKNWKLPTSNNTNLGSFGGLVATLTGTDNTTKLAQLTGDGYFFVRGGYVGQSSALSAVGDEGDYWSSTPSSVYNYSYIYTFFFRFAGINAINPSEGSYRTSGLSIRCVAR